VATLANPHLRRRHHERLIPFGSSLNVHPHFHVVVLDGVFSALSEAGDHEVRFHGASELSPPHVQQLEATVQRRVLRQFARRGLLDEADADDTLSWQGSGGFSVDASVRIEGEDRAGIERLVRYCARPPFALERLYALDGASSLASPESRLLYRFPKPDVHGRTEIRLTPLGHGQPQPYAPGPLAGQSPPRHCGTRRTLSKISESKTSTRATADGTPARTTGRAARRSRPKSTGGTSWRRCGA
jgi:hypothetical protein